MTIELQASRVSSRSKLQSIPALSRRSFLRASAAASGGLLLGLSLPFSIGKAEAAADGVFAPNAFVRIGSDGKIVLTMPYVEMGQGTYTAIPMLIAEELEVDLQQVILEHAVADEKLYVNPLLGIQATGNSNAIRGAWQPLRQAGAVARTMLVAAAAERWEVDPATCRAEKGEVVHTPTGRRLGYGELALDAGQVPAPESVELKQPQDFKLIGTPAKRPDTPAKVNGTAGLTGIDVRPPGVKVATLAQSPVFGGRVKSVDDAAARAVKGVRQIVRLDDAVAVVADDMGAAKKGLEALVIQWDDGPHAGLTTEAIAAELEQAVGHARLVAKKSAMPGTRCERGDQSRKATYPPPFLAHAHGAYELHGSRARPRVRRSGQIQTVSLGPGGRRGNVGLPLEKVIVHNHLLGGGFGRRLDVDGVTRAVEIARHVNGPVKVVWTREEDIQHDMYRPDVVHAPVGGP